MSSRLLHDQHGRVPEQLIGAVIPDPARPVPARRVPLAVLPAAPRPGPALPNSPALIGTARIDRSGRLQHGRILAALRWRPGDDLRIVVAGLPDSGVALLITRDESEPVRDDRRPARPAHPRASRSRVDPRGAITLAGPIRALSRIAAGTTSVLVAQPSLNRLLVWSATVAAARLVDEIDGPDARRRDGGEGGRG